MDGECAAIEAAGKRKTHRDRQRHRAPGIRTGAPKDRPTHTTLKTSTRTDTQTSTSSTNLATPLSSYLPSQGDHLGDTSPQLVHRASALARVASRRRGYPRTLLRPATSAKHRHAVCREGGRAASCRPPAGGALDAFGEAGAKVPMYKPRYRVCLLE